MMSLSSRMLSNIVGQPLSRDQCYDVTISSDSSICAVNPKFLAITIEAVGSGAFMALPLHKTGKIESNHPLVSGHKGAVLDLSWCPFNDNIIASSSVDGIVRVWQIPDEGLVRPLTEPSVKLNGHQKQVDIILWHPCANNVLLSASRDCKILIWNVSSAQVLFTINHPDLIWSVCWNFEGTRIVTTCKDTKIRIYDPRTSEMEQDAIGHNGDMPQKAIFLRNGLIFTSGFSRMSEQQYALRSEIKLSEPICMQQLDRNNGLLLPIYDPDVNLLYLYEKGDSNIRYFEMMDETPYLQYINTYKASKPHRCIASMPKRGCDINNCEISRFYKVNFDGYCEVISFTVLKKSSNEIFRDTSSDTPAISADEWASGKEAEPVMAIKCDIEKTYRHASQEEHVLIRPSLYIGSPKIIEKARYIYNEDEHRMVKKVLSYPPGLLKIFDEIVANAVDNKSKDPKMDKLEVNINPKENKINVWNNGKGIPIVIHKTYNEYLPSILFSKFLTSSNFNDYQEKPTAGRHGYGAKLTNIFSTKFIVETSDRESKKKFKQIWTANKTKTEGPEIFCDIDVEDCTSITFFPDLEKFNMKEMTNDIINIFIKRCFDIAACSEGITVLINKRQVPISNFLEYIHLFIGKKEDIIYDNSQKNWEIAVVPNNEFECISFVNKNETLKGTHVNYVLRKICRAIAEKIMSSKSVTVTPSKIKKKVMIFINCLIINPDYGNQIKDYLITDEKNFGSKYEMENTILNNIFIKNLLQFIFIEEKEKKELELCKKMTGRKVVNLKIPKLLDAHNAGTIQSENCTLIITEGDSAKSLVISGLGILGRDNFGVFPLKGKLLNVREASDKQIMENEEINNIIKIMGLEYKKNYETIEDLKKLRYGRLMVMTDQDQDGSHIKGLVINFIHHIWPSLLKLPILQGFITPIVKMSKGNEVKSFYSIPEYEKWKNEIPNWTSYRIKYYKGLGTHTAKEAKEYFSDIERHRIQFQYTGSEDDYSIEMAFSKDSIEERKEWLKNGMEKRRNKIDLGLPLYCKDAKKVSYTDFVNKELIEFSIMDLKRSIPSVVDGLKPGQRKIIYTCLKRNDKKEIKVAQLAGSVAEHSAYHHGEASLCATIINLAQNFVGSNNINLLLPIGQFGTRLQGGTDFASARYIYTKLNPVIKTLFPSPDFPILNYLFDDNQKIEPEYYVPVIPMVLVNGAEGIGTGWSTKIPNYNPRDIVKNIYLMLDGKEPEEMTPWYKNFTGRIKKNENQQYVTTGKVSILENDDIEISELPVKTWTENFKENLESEKLISDYKEYNTDTTVRFILKINPDTMVNIQNIDIYKQLKLLKTISTKNMFLFNKEGIIQKYESPEEILKEYFNIRYLLYEKRREYLIKSLEEEALRINNQARFIEEMIQQKIQIHDKEKTQRILYLKEKNFEPDPLKEKEKIKDLKESDKETELSSRYNFDYLLNMSFFHLTPEKNKELVKRRDDLINEIKEMKNKSAADLWRKDLEKFCEQLEELERKEKCDIKKNRPDTEPSAQGKIIEPFKKITKRTSLDDDFEKIQQKRSKI